MTDEGLIHLAGLSNLEELRLSRTQVTDVGLSHIHGLKALKRLDLRETSVSDQAIAELRSAIPALKVQSGKIAARRAIPNPP